MRKHQLVLQLFVFQIQSALSAAPESVDTSPVVEKLTFLIPECPRSLCEQTELQQICSTPNGGILKHISHIFQSLLDWAYDPNAFAKNPAYRFRHITAACLLTGSTAVLNVLVEEILKAGSLMGSAQSTIAMEVAHAIICTPVPERHNKGAMTLRSALSNNQLLYYGRNGVPSIDTGSYISGGRESIIEDLHRAVLQSHTTMIEDSDHDFMQEAPILRSQVRAFSGMEEGLGLTGVPTDLAIDFGSQPLDPSGVTPLTGDPLATNIDFGNLPLDFDLSQPLPTIDTKPLTAQPALDPNSMLTDMDLEAVLPFMDEAAQANALQLPIGSVEDYQPDPNYDVAQLQALGSDFNFDADAWDDFAGFDDAVLPQLRGDGAGGGRGAGTLGTGTGLDVAGANLDGMDFAFLDSQA